MVEMGTGHRSRLDTASGRSVARFRRSDEDSIFALFGQNE
jgi:hypothetical protein